VEARLQELTLLDPKTGKPLGKGLGDIFDHQIVALPNYRFQKSGTYTIKLKQYMRQDPLPDVMSVGVRVEKASGN
jgi:gliding motility-associated lipoprotein GldH